jgi:ABC-type oligopeptide transport system ATPase subunit
LDLQQRLNLTMLFISHDLSVVKVLCDRVVVMQNGQIVEVGSSAEIYGNPKQQYTRDLLNAIPIPDPARAKRQAVA